MKILVDSWKQKTIFDGNSHLDNSVQIKKKKNNITSTFLVGKNNVRAVMFLARP